MKIRKVKYCFNFHKHINKKGMALLEFLFAFMFVFMLIVMFMQIGFVLRHESVVIAATKSLARQVEINGELTQNDVNTINQKLRDVNIGVGISDNNIFYRINNIDFHPGGGGGTVSLAFRQDFKLSIKTYYRARSIDIPLVFVTGGKSERFRY